MSSDSVPSTSSSFNHNRDCDPSPTADSSLLYSASTTISLLFFSMYSTNSSFTSSRRRVQLSQTNNSHKNTQNIHIGLTRKAICLRHYCLLACIFFLISFECAQAATFFYGATQNDMLSSADSVPNIADIETAKLSREQLKDVYKFCRYLPSLIKSGHIAPGGQSTEICKNIVSLLDPLFNPAFEKRDCGDESDVNCKRQKRSSIANRPYPRRRIARRRHIGH